MLILFSLFVFFFPKRLKVAEYFQDRAKELDKKAVPVQTQRIAGRITITECGLATALTVALNMPVTHFEAIQNLWVLV